MPTNYHNTRMLDMVFENRNKSYGAYALRNDSDRRTSKALLITFSCLFFLGSGKFISDKMKGAHLGIQEKEVIVEITDLTKPVEAKVEPPKPEPQKPQEAQAKETQRDPEMKVVANNTTPTDSLPTIDEMRDKEPGLTSNAGGLLGVEKGTGPATIPGPEHFEEPPTIYGVTEEPPVFPGGEKALMAFLQDHTVYPDREREMEIEGKAVVKFVVNEDGSISNATAVRNDSPGFGKEGRRVVGEMPKFKPGRQQGKAVKVYFVVPFSFKLNH
jgi:protein TonB